MKSGSVSFAFLDIFWGNGNSEQTEAVAQMDMTAPDEMRRQQAELQQQVKVGIDQLDGGERIKVATNELRAFFDDIQARGQQRYEASRDGH